MTVNNDNVTFLYYYFVKQLGNLSFRLFVANMVLKACFFFNFILFYRLTYLGVLMKTFIPMTFPVGHWLSMHELTTYAYI